MLTYSFFFFYLKNIKNMSRGCGERCFFTRVIKNVTIQHPGLGMLRIPRWGAE